MLKPPYRKYKRIFVYNFDRIDIGEVNDPDLIGTWIEDDTAILFFHREKAKLIDYICNQSGAHLIYQADLDYHDWEAGVDIASFTISPLVVSPIWEQKKVSLPKGHQSIIFDPSVIFGSGFHPTTRLCLETLTELIENYGKINSVLDLGTGTGLLSIAAAKLGSTQVSAIDNNPFACQVAENNISMNNLERFISVTETDLRVSLPTTKVDLVITNLYKGLLTELFNNPEFWHAKYYIISGFIPSMEEDLLSCLPMDQLILVTRKKHDNWRLWLIKNTKPQRNYSEISATL